MAAEPATVEVRLAGAAGARTSREGIVPTLVSFCRKKPLGAAGAAIMLVIYG